MKIAIFLSILSLAISTTAIAEDKPADEKNIQGTWLPIKADLSGQPMKDEFLKKITLVLGSRTYEVAAESIDKGTFTINPTAKPKTIDIMGVEGPNAGKRIYAIYEVHGDTLRICYGLGGSPRPAEFKSPVGSQYFLVTYKRKKG